LYNKNYKSRNIKMSYNLGRIQLVIYRTMVADGRTCLLACNCKPFLNVSLNFSGHVIRWWTTMTTTRRPAGTAGQWGREERKRFTPNDRTDGSDRAAFRLRDKYARRIGETDIWKGVGMPCAYCIVRISMQQLAMVSIPTNMHKCRYCF
jgi:hypothetical protein